MFDDLISAKTFELLSEITSDHVPTLTEIPQKPCIFSDQPTSAGSGKTNSELVKDFRFERKIPRSTVSET